MNCPAEGAKNAVLKLEFGFLKLLQSNILVQMPKIMPKEEAKKECGIERLKGRKSRQKGLGYVKFCYQKNDP